MPPRAAGHEDLMILWGYVWAGLMFVTAAANGLVALEFTRAWPAFIAVFPLASKLALFAVQYASVRRVIIRRRAAGWGAAQPQVQGA
jgi:hypothetical protein